MTHMDDILSVVGMAEVRRRAECYDALVEALEAVYRVAKDADLPGPVYLSIAERHAIRAALALAREEA